MMDKFRKLPTAYKVALIAALVSVVALLAVTIRFWLVPLALVGMGIVWYIDKDRENQVRQAQAQAYWREVLRRSVLDCLFTAAVECCEVIGVRRPRQMEEIATTPPFIFRNGLWMVAGKLRLTSNSFRTPDELEDVIFELQGAMDSLLNAYGCEYIPATSWDRQWPLFVVDRVAQKGATLIVEIVVSDTPATSGYLTARRNQDPHLLTPAEPEDERF